MSLFTDKVSIVTGAASGIGKALCEALANSGARVIATDVNLEMLQRTADAVSRKGGKILAAQLDVTNYNAFEQVVNDTVAQEGRLDYIFNNAGIAIVGEVRDVTVDHWRKVLDVNLNGVVYGSILAYRQMVKQGSGHIVNLASIEGLIPFANTISYVASKFAVVGLSKGLWVEGADLGVKVSAVCPGFIKTPIFDVSPMINVDRKEALKIMSTWERLGITPEECARRILKGVARNKSIIPVTGLAWVMYWLSRISPSLVMHLAKIDCRKARKRARVDQLHQEYQQ